MLSSADKPKFYLSLISRPIRIRQFTDTFNALTKRRALIAKPVAFVSYLAPSLMLPTLAPRPSSTVESPRSVYGGAPTTIHFVNRFEYESAQVFWIDFDGNRVLFAAVAPGGFLSQLTHVGHPWEVSISRRNETIQVIYFPTALDSDAILDKSLFPVKTLLALKPSELPSLLSAKGGAATAIEFDNRLQVAVKVCWIDYHGKNIPYAKIPPGQTCRQVTFVGHPWSVVEEDEKEPFAIFYPASYEGTAVIDNSLLSG